VPVTGQITRAYLLTQPHESLTVQSDASGIRVTVPKEKPDPIASVVVLDITGVKSTSILGPAADGSIHLGAGDADIKGSLLTVEGGEPSNLGFWTDSRDYATWTFRVAKAGLYTPELTYASQPGSGGSRIELSCDGQKSSATIVETKGWADYRPLSLSALNLKAGNATLTVKATQMPNGAVMNLRSIVLKPVK